jgi:hypothetical protein
MPYNVNSGYGQFLADKVLNKNPGAGGGNGSYPNAGKTFLVMPTTHQNYAATIETLIPDPDGLPRFYTTLSAALLNCVADRGDTIYIAEGYTEAITAAWGGVPIAGVRVVGLGDGTNRPTFNFTTATTANMALNAARFSFSNCVFTIGFDAVVAMLPVTAADVSFFDCEFNTNNATMGCVQCIVTAATAARLRVISCRFMGPAVNTGTTTTSQIDHEVGVDYLFQNNYHSGKMTQAIVNATTVLRGSIDSNRFVISTGTAAITMAAGSTPFITNNKINVPSGSAPIVAAAGFVAGNVYSAAAGVTAVAVTQ